MKSTLVSLTDEQLMEAVKGGDLHPAAILFDRYHKRIFNFLAQLTRDRALAEDLAQNTFLRMIKYRTSFRSDHRFQGWLYQMARNVFSDHYQMQKNRTSKFVNIDNMEIDVADHQHIDHEAREELLQRSMAKLTDEQRELLILTRFQRMKYEEVANLMDTTVANIKVKVHRAIACLREHYFELEKS